MSDNYKFLSIEYVKNLPKEPVEALNKVFKEYFNASESDRYKYISDLIGLLTSFNKKNPRLVPINTIKSLHSSIDKNYKQSLIESDFNNIYFKVTEVFHIKNAKERIKKRELQFDEILDFGDVDNKFSAKDKKTIQQLINELRDLIINSEIEDEHKKRLLRKLENLQSELHKDLPYRQVLMGEITEIIVFIKMIDRDTAEIQEKCRKIFNYLIKPIGRVLGLPIPDIWQLPSGKEERETEDIE